MKCFNVFIKKAKSLLLVLAVSLLTVAAWGAVPMGPKRSNSRPDNGTGRYELVTFNGIPTDVEKADFKRHGVTVLRYVSQPQEGQFTYVAYVATSNTLKWKKLRGSEDLIGRLPYRGDGQSLRVERLGWKEKCDGELVQAYESNSVQALPTWVVGGGEGVVRVTITYIKEYGESVVREGLQAVRFKLDFISTYASYLQGEILIGDLPALAEQMWVEKVRLASPPDELHNEKSAALIGVRKLQQLEGLGKGLTGKGVSVGVFDATVVPHKDFGSRLHIEESEGVQDPHGTHVSGTIAGAGTLDARAKGMAPEATLYTWNFSGEVPDKFAKAHSNYSVRITSNSYGIPIDGPIGCQRDRVIEYSEQNKGIDEVLLSQPTMAAIFSAGNSQGDCNRDKRGYQTVSRTTKNGITVGAVDAMGKMTNFSSWGPLKDGRMAPLICADGFGIYSTSYNDGYESMNGTSMACPAVSGLTALLYQQFRAENGGKDPQFILVKNALLNTADDAGGKGPDFQYGYGIANGVKASNMLSEKRYLLAEVANGEVGTHVLKVPENVAKLRVMIVWHDPGVQGFNQDLVNDLDLELRGKQVYRPWLLDATNYDAPASRGRDGINNHEQVEVDAPPAGDYNVVVTGYRIPEGKVAYSVTWEFDYDTPAIELTYPLGGEKFISNDETFAVRWVNARPNEPVEIHISYDDGQTWREVQKALGGDGQAAVPFGQGHELEEKVRVRVVQGGTFSASKAAFSVAPSLVIESEHNLCAQDPTVKWKKVGDGLTYNVAYYDSASKAHNKIKSGLQDTIVLLENYNADLPVAVQVCRGTWCSDYSAPTFPHATRPLVIDTDRNRFVAFRLDDRGDIGNIYSTLTLGSDTYAAHSEGLVLAYGDKDPAWREPVETDARDVFELNPTHVASVWTCLDLRSLDAESLKGHTVLGVITAVPMPMLARNDLSGHSAWVRFVACDEQGNNPQLLQNSQGVSVRNATMSLEQLKAGDFDLTPYAGKRMALRVDMALKGSNSAGYNDAAMVGKAQFAVMASKDIALTALEVPTSSETLGTQETVTIEVRNRAHVPLENQEVSIRLFEGATLLGEWSETVNIKGLGTWKYDLPQKFDFSSPMHHYKLRAEVSMDGDMRAENNSKSASLTNLKGYILMPALTRLPVLSSVEQVAIGSETKIFTDNMGPNDAVQLKVKGSYVDVKSVGALRLKPAATGKYVKITMREVDLGENCLNVYLFEGSEKKLIYRFTENQGEGAELSTQESYQELLFEYDTKNDKQPVQGWEAEVVEVDAPVVNVSNDRFEVTALKVASSSPSSRRMQLGYKNLTGKKQDKVKAGLFLSDWEGSQTRLCVDEFSAGEMAAEQSHTFSQSVALPANEEVRLLALLSGGDAILENNIQYARLYEGEYEPATSIRISDEKNGYSGPQLVAVAIGENRYQTEEVSKQAQLRSYPQNYADRVFNVAPGAKVALQITAAKVMYRGASVSVWVDWDNNKTFDATSEFVGRATAQNKETQLEVEIKVPATTANGDKRMRIVIVEGEDVEATLEANDRLGEVEDYTLRIGSSVAPTTTKDAALLFAELSADASKIDVQLLNNNATETIENLSLFVKVDENAEEEYSQTFSLAAGSRESLTVQLSETQKTQLASVGDHKVLVYHSYADDQKFENNQRVLSYRVAAPIVPVAGEYVLSFDGSGGSARMDDFDESTMPALTYESWVCVDKFSLFSGSSGLNRLFETAGTSLYFCGEGNKNLPANSVVALLSDVAIYASPANQVTPGKWMHVALTVDRTTPANPTIKLYLNGENVPLNSIGSKGTLQTRGLVVGNRGDGKRSLVGAVDAFRVWNEVRSEAQIKESMGQRNATGPALVAEFDFGEGEGSLVAQATGGAKELTVAPSGVAWLPEPKLQVLTWGVADVQERQDEASKWALNFESSASLEAVKFEPEFSLPGVEAKVGGNPVTTPVDLSSGSCNVSLTWSWLGDNATDNITISAYKKTSTLPQLKTLQVAGMSVTVQNDMVVNLSTAAVNLYSMQLRFEVAPAECVVKIGGKTIASGDQVDLSRPVLIEVHSPSGFEKTCYQLSVTMPVSVTWVASALEFTYGEENIAAFNAKTVNPEHGIFYEVEDKAVAQVVGSQLKINGAGQTKVKAYALLNGRPMSGGAERSLTVKKAPLAVTAENVSVDFSDPMPKEYRVIYSGFVYGENEKDLTTPATAACAAKQGDAHGTYPITVSGAQSPNYDVSYTNGTLTIVDVPHYEVTFQFKAPAASPTMELEGLKLSVAGREYAANSEGKVVVDLKARPEPYAWSFEGVGLTPKLENEQGEVVFDGVKTVEIQLRVYARRLKVNFVAEGGCGTVNGEGSLTLEVPEGSASPVVEAKPNFGYAFSEWISTADDLTADQKKTPELKIPAVTKDNVTYTAKFIKLNYTVEYVAEGEGEIIGNASQIKPYDDMTDPVEAKAKGSAIFVGWDDGKRDTKRSDRVQGNKKYVARFVKAQPLPFAEDFEDGNSTRDLWENTGVKGKWEYKKEVGKSYSKLGLGTGLAAGYDMQTTSAASGATVTVQLTTPYLDVTDKLTVDLAFDYIGIITSMDKAALRVEYSIDGAEFKELWNPTTLTAGKQKFEQTLGEDIIRAAGTLRVRWTFEATNSGYWSSSCILIDNVNISGVNMASEYTLTYAVEGDGYLEVDGNKEGTTYSKVVPRGQNGPSVKVVAYDPAKFTFKGWSDGSSDNPRQDVANSTIDVKATVGPRCDIPVVVTATAPYLEAFEQELTCWELSAPSNEAAWKQDASKCGTTGNGIRVDVAGMNHTTPPQAMTLTSPLYDLSGSSKVTVKFCYTFADFEFKNSLLLHYSLDGGVTWEATPLISFEPGHYTLDDLVRNGEVSFVLPKVSSTVRFRWSTSATLNMGEGAFAMDDFSLSAASSIYTFTVVTNPAGLAGAGAAVTNADGTPLASLELTAGQLIKVTANAVTGYTAALQVEGATDKGNGTYEVTGNVTITVTYTPDGTTPKPTIYAFTVVTKPASLAGAGASVTNADGTPLASLELTAGQVIKVTANAVTGYTAALQVEGATDKGNGTYEVSGNVTITVTYTSISPVEFVVLREVAVHPNPATTVLYLENVSAVERLSVVSSSGVVVLRRENSASEATMCLHLEGFAEGVYWLVVEGGGGHRAIPFVVKL